MTYDNVNKPKHYNVHPSGVECIEITRHLNFNLGNAFKYLFRREHKNELIENLEKAAWYLKDEIKNMPAGTYVAASKNLEKVCDYEPHPYNAIMMRVGRNLSLEPALVALETEILKLKQSHCGQDAKSE